MNWVEFPFNSLLVPKQILATYKTDPKVNELFMNLDLLITPVLNMDGYAYSWKDNTVCPLPPCISTKFGGVMVKKERSGSASWWF